MNLLTVEKVTKSYTDRKLFEQITLGIHGGDKIGVIGVNGSGKSTLLKIIAGLEEPDEGTILKGNKVHVEYLAQTPKFNLSKGILENILDCANIEEDIWNREAEAKTILNKLGIYDYSEKIEYLSGGQKKRIALVRALLIPSDILILDEPTNHLDSEMAQWLEEYLSKYKGALVMVTHDRYFLDKVTNKIVELDKGNLYSYIANYSKFLELKAQREEMELATENKNKSLYRVELEWMMRGARARSTKQKAHIGRFEELRDRKKIVEDNNVQMDSIVSRLGKKTVELLDISKSFGEKKLINHFSYIMLKGDRLGVIGKNGCGKSTLLKMIYGIIKPDTGYVNIGETVKIGYFSQENEFIEESMRVIDYMKEVGEYIQTINGTITASQMLEKFLFTGAMQYSLISKLSGGERRRLYLLRILMSAPNILILDEPTNDLDIKTLTILEEYLDSFPGIVMAVSHDRYFLDRIVNRIFAFEENGVIRQYEGGFTQYKTIYDLEHRGEEQINLASTEKKVKSKVKETKLKFTYNEQKEFEEIDQMIENLETELQEIEIEVEKSACNYALLKDLIEKKEELEKTLEKKMDRWIYLNDLAEKIAKEK